MIASQAHVLLANGMGGIDWAGLPVVCELLGVGDVEGLLQRLATIKTWRRPDIAGRGD